jgi:hypothetical protein
MWGEDFQCDHPVEIPMAGFVNGAHPALAEQFENFEVREVPGDFCRGNRGPFLFRGIGGITGLAAKADLHQALGAETFGCVRR